MVVGLESWTLARPELFLAAVTALLLIYGVVRGEASTAFVSVSTALALLVTAVLLFTPYREGTAFASLFIVDRLTATMKALVLVGIGVFVIGLVDNLLRPILVGRDVGMPDYLVLLATLGGLAVFGVSGFVIGPIIAAFFLTVWGMFAEEQSRRRP